MALSGTTLTVTTLLTTGILTNNSSGQISSVTGSGLAALLGGAPTFTGLTLSSLVSVMLKTNGSGVLVAATAGTDYQAAMSAGLNMSLAGNVCATLASPSFSGLTLSSTLSTLLKTNGSGVVSGAVAGTDYQAALTAGTNITITSNTIATATIPTFAGINCVSIGSQNTLCGTSAGINLTSNGSGGNSFYGYQAGQSCTSGGLNLAFGNGALSSGTALTGQGFNSAFGVSALYGVSGTGRHNIGIGYLSGFNLTTGSYCVYIGDQSYASSGTVTNEGVINLTGSVATGKGANTMYIPATAGFFCGQYIPSVSAGVPTYLSNANGSYVSLPNGLLFQWVQWTTLSFGGLSNNQPTWTFPVTWPNRAIFVAVALPGTSYGAITTQYNTLTTSSVLISMYNNYNGAQSGAPIFYALGY